MSLDGTEAETARSRAPAPEDFNCIGCAPRNPRGLHLRVSEGERCATARVCLDRDYEGHPGAIHGGVIATILDEIMGRATFCATGEPAMTTLLRIRYSEPMHPEQAYIAIGEVVSQNGDTLQVRGELQTEARVTIAAATSTYRLIETSGFPSEASLGSGDSGVRRSAQ